MKILYEGMLDIEHNQDLEEEDFWWHEWPEPLFWEEPFFAPAAMEIGMWLDIADICADIAAEYGDC